MPENGVGGLFLSGINYLCFIEWVRSFYDIMVLRNEVKIWNLKLERDMEN